MKSRHPHPSLRVLTSLTVGLRLLAPDAVRAAPPVTPTRYKSQVIAHAGDTIGGVQTSVSGHLNVGALNDRGQIVFTATSGAGEVLVEYSDGQLKPLVAPGQPSPEGTWPKDAGFDYPVSINQSGNIVFGVHEKSEVPWNPSEATNLGTYRWDAHTQSITVVAAKGLPAVNNLTFEEGSFWFPTINDLDEIAFPAYVMNATGGKHLGTFLRGADGQLQPVALPGDPLPGGGKVIDAWPSVVNNAGVVAFSAQPPGKDWSVYIWEKGTLSPVLLSGAAAPGGGRIVRADWAWVNNKNRSVLVEASHNSLPDGLYLWSNGTLSPVAEPGQEMPGGGLFNGVLNSPGYVSLANEAGQYAFIAQLKDNSTAAYLIDADGTLSLILKSGTTTDLGTITQVGEGMSPSGVAINSAGQVALDVKVTGQPRALVLLTPVTQ